MKYSLLQIHLFRFNISIKDLSIASGIASPTISKILNKKGYYSSSTTMLKIAKTLGYKVEELFTLDEKQNNSSL